MAIAGVVFIALEGFCAVRVEAVTVGGDPPVNPANFRITEFASGLNYPGSMAQLAV